jgi:hypothetical protein
MKLFIVKPTMFGNKIEGCDYRSFTRIARVYLPFTEQIIAYHSCQANEAVSLLNRHLIKSIPNNDMLKASIRGFKLLRQHYPPQFLRPITVEQVVALKRGSKRKTYKNALQSYYRRGIVRRDCGISMFVKYERMSVRNPFKPPRAIQARGAVFNMVLQQYLIPFAHHLIRSDELRKRYVTKGMDNYQVAQLLHRAWQSFLRPVALLLDHDRFDSRANSIWTRPMHRYICDHFQEREPRFLVKQLRVGRCKTLKGLVYIVGDIVFSGDVTTGEGNSVINRSILEDFTVLIQCFIALNGDDSVIILEFDDLPTLLSRDLMCYGFKTKLQVVYSFSDIEYCQCKPVHTVNGWLMVRDPLRVMSRSTTCIRFLPSRTTLAWFSSVGECEQSCNIGVPILAAFASWLMRASTHRIKIESEIYMHRIRRTFSRTIITSEARLSFMAAFGIPPSTQIMLESYFDLLGWDFSFKVVDFPTSPTLTIS